MCSCSHTQPSTLNLRQVLVHVGLICPHEATLASNNSLQRWETNIGSFNKCYPQYFSVLTVCDVRQASYILIGCWYRMWKALWLTWPSKLSGTFEHMVCIICIIYGILWTTFLYFFVVACVYITMLFELLLFIYTRLICSNCCCTLFTQICFLGMFF